MTEPKCTLQRTCVLHVDKKHSPENIKLFDDESWARVKACDLTRRDHCSSSKYLSVRLPESYNDTVGYHTTCYKNFTAVHDVGLSSKASGDNNQEGKNYTLRSETPSTSTDPQTGIFAAKCLFCGVVKKSKGQFQKEGLGSCETGDSAKAIYDAATKLNDQQMLARISGIDIISKEVKYHHSCKRNYLRKADVHNERPVIPEPTKHQQAFIFLSEYIRENLIDSEGAQFLTSLHSKYMERLGEQSSYSARSLHERIKKDFPELKECKQSNKTGIILYNPTLSEETAIKRANFDHNSIIETAHYLRNLVKQMEKNIGELPEPLNTETLSKGQAEPPDDLKKFFQVLYTGSSGKLGNSNRCSFDVVSHLHAYRTNPKIH